MKKGATAAVGQLGHHVFVRKHGSLTILGLKLSSHRRASALFGSIEIGCVKAAGVQRVDSDMGLRGGIQNLGLEDHGCRVGGEKSRRDKDEDVLSWERAHLADNQSQETEIASIVLFTQGYGTAGCLLRDSGGEFRDGDLG